jgi:proline dehydrogenase
MKDMFEHHSEKHSDGKLVLDREGVIKFLKNYNIGYTEAEVDEFFQIAKFEDSKYSKDKIGEIEFFENVHAHYINSDNHNTAIIKRICESVQLNSDIRAEILRFQKRALKIVDKATEYGTVLLIDAEQTYIQKALDGYTRQMQSIYHKDRKAFILNGYQSYLKASNSQIAREIERCKTLGIGFGIKLIRGAYMGEERRIAETQKIDSPV